MTTTIAEADLHIPGMYDVPEHPDGTPEHWECVPAHLGPMGGSVEGVNREHVGGAGGAASTGIGKPLKPGDVYILNDPYAGGTHLPDVTVITPVFDEAGQHILFYVGSRGHHADIGGMTPGSMPPDSRSIEKEGVLLTDFQLVEGGVQQGRIGRLAEHRLGVVAEPDHRRAPTGGIIGIGPGVPP